jgi:2,4-dienoyl-CoA reductase-like NADH-dependent reductase (Old Yellow Enzyme family)
MTEGLADSRNDPTTRHLRLYSANASGGAGLILTGNAMVDRRHLERSRNVVLDSETNREALRKWADASGPHALVQISHPGRQSTRFVQSHPVSPSGGPAVDLAGLFARPRELTGEEIVEGLREALPDRAVLAIKLDARDGDGEDLAWLGRRLGEAGADLLEISGGNYEAPAMLGLEADGSEIQSAHESPFWQGAAAVSKATEVPVMLTGGFRTRSGVDQALESGVAAMVGVGRPLAVRPELAGEFLRAETDMLARPAPRVNGPGIIRRLSGAAANSGWHRLQMKRTAEGSPPDLKLGALAAAGNYIAVDALLALAARRSRMKLAARARPAG